MLKVKKLLLLFVCCCPLLSMGQDYPLMRSTPDSVIKIGETEVEIRFLAKDLVIPWEMIWGYDNWLWFNEREGNIKKLNLETGEIKLIHRIDSVYQSYDNSGMESMVMHPQFPEQPYIYVHYATSFTETVMIRMTYDVETESITDWKMMIDDVKTRETHMGSRLKFDKEGKLYFATGDARVKKIAQDLTSNNGKILRMNDDGSIPDDNPFPGTYIYSYGHRDPQGLVFAPDGTLYSSEHGDDDDDEVNIIMEGRNYGYPKVKGECDKGLEKGRCKKLNIVEPIYSWSPTVAVCGIDYYDHPSIPLWNNAILAGTLKKNEEYQIGQRLIVLKLTDDGQKVADRIDYFDSTFGRIRSVTVAPDGRVFLATSNREKNGRGRYYPGDDKIIELRPSSLNGGGNTSLRGQR